MSKITGMPNSLRAYALFDRYLNDTVGVLLYYKKEKTFIVELKDSLDEWTAPLLFAGLVKKGIFTVPRDITLAWVRERVIPPGRQNIDAILTHHRLKEYDEMKLLELSGGKCSQDEICIKELDALPAYVERRMSKNLAEAVMCENGRILCIFRDNTVRLFDLKEHKDDIEDIEKILSNPALYESGKVGTGGYFLTFNDSMDIPAATLYRNSVLLPLTLSDLIAFIRKNVADTSATCRMLGCTRQNLTYMQDKGQLAPVKNDVKGNLFLKGDVIKNLW